MSSFPNNSTNSLLDIFLIAILMERLQFRNPIEDGREELIRQERELEREVIRIIDNGNGDSLMPNSGQAVSVLDHSICVQCHEDDEGYCMVWEWHGHITAYTELGYSPEHIYGNYFQRLRQRTLRAASSSGAEKDAEEKGNQGLKDLIDDRKDSGAGRILHCNRNAPSPPRNL